MQLLLFLMVIGTVYSTNNCPYLYDGLRYDRKEILRIKGLPTNLVLNPETQDLYFTLIDVESLHNNDIQTQMAQYVLQDNTTIKIDSVNGQAAAYDYKNKVVYIATDNGLYSLNANDKTKVQVQVSDFTSLKNEDIVQVFKTLKGDELYAVLFPGNKLAVTDVNTKVMRHVENIPSTIFVAVDGENNIFYQCDSGHVEVLPKGFQEPIEFVGIPKNSAKALTVDAFNKVILAAKDGLYSLSADNIIPKKLMDLEYIPSGLAVSVDTLYVATTDVIFKYSMGPHCEVNNQPPIPIIFN